MAGEGDAERLVLLLEARIKDFEKNMAKASGTATTNYSKMRRDSASATRQMEADMVRSTTRVNQALASTSTRIGSFGRTFSAGVIAPIAGLLSLTAAVNGTRAALEKFGGIADKAAAGGVDAEFFQGIAYQANLAGVDINGVASALETFAKNSGLAAEGKGRMVSTLQALNPELLKSIQAATTQEERFKLVAEALRNASSAAQAAAIASAAFGGEGPKIVAAFRGGADEIDRMQKKAKEMGLIVDRELIARADELGDEFDTVTQIVDLELKSALVDLAGPLIQLAKLAAGFAREIREVAAILQNPDEWLPWLAGTSAAESRMGKLLEQLRTERGQSQMDAALGLEYGAGGMHETFMGAGSMRSNQVGNGALAKDIEALFGVKMAAADARVEVAYLHDEVGGGGGSFEDMIKTFGGDKPKTAPGGIRPETIAETTDALDKLREKAATLKEEMRDPFETLQFDLDQLGAMLHAKALDWDEFGEAAFRAKSKAVGAAAGMASEMTGILSGMFEDNKTFAIANAVVSGIEGVAKTLSAYPAPWSFAMAGLQAAAAGAQVSAIMSTNKNSKTMPGTGGSSGGGSTPPPQAAPQAASPTFNITLKGGSRYSREEIEGLLRDMNDALADGARLNINR